MNTTPEGWYRDPADATRVRWFDGQTWTAHSQPAPEPGSGPLAPPATTTARAAGASTPPAPVAMVIPELEPDEPDEYEDEYEPEAPAAPVEVAPAAEHPAEPAYQPTGAQAPAQYRDEYAPPPVPLIPVELPPYVSPKALTYGQAAAPTSPPTTPVDGTVQVGPAATYPPAAGYPQAAPAGYPNSAPAGYPQVAAAYPQAAGAWPESGAAAGWPPPPEASKSAATTVLIALACSVGGVILIGILAAIAIPVFLNQREKPPVANAGAETVTCSQVADYAVQVSAAGQSQDQAPLTAVADITIVQDNRATFRVPDAGEDPAFVVSCHGTGTKTDGTTAPVTANLYVDSTNQQLVAYAWDL